jgi:predicted dehydrogenase
MYGMIEYDNGRVGMIESSRQASLTQELQVAGSRGILTMPIAWTIMGDTAITIRRSEGWDRLLGDTYQVAGANAYQLQLENFAAVIRGEAAPAVPLAESVVNTYTVEALVTSALEKRPVSVEVPDRLLDSLD